ncbi:MAG: DUF4097 domain-containing protein [Gemmatimonadales bacterium]
MGMSTGVRGGAGTVVIAFVLAAGSATAQEQPFRWSGPLAPGQVIEVKGILGTITAELAPGGEAEVVAEKRGRSSDFADVEIRVVEEADGVTICAVHHPEDYDSDDCDLDDRSRDRRRNDRRGARVDVDFTVLVPAGVELIGTVVSGDVDVRGLRSDVSAHSVSGDVAVSTTGVVEAGTVSGSLDVEMGSLDWRHLSFNTVSGDVTLRVPENLEAEVDFESLSGRLDTDFDMRVEERRNGRFVGSRVEGIIGDGGRRLTFHTVSGSVRLLRAR